MAIQGEYLSISPSIPRDPSIPAIQYPSQGSPGKDPWGIWGQEAEPKGDQEKEGIVTLPTTSDTRLRPEPFPPLGGSAPRPETTDRSRSRWSAPTGPSWTREPPTGVSMREPSGSDISGPRAVISEPPPRTSPGGDHRK